jgi:hypothetical protein
MSFSLPAYSAMGVRAPAMMKMWGMGKGRK